jgi:phosphopantothenoylcysteine decarboxylase/phosphopantothenate--cysteine ligase
MNLKDKKILLGITGGIAVYKTAELVRRWTQAGAEVEIVMTQAATEFVTPLTFETLANRRVHTDLFPKHEFSATIHIDLADWADVVIIAPATADVIAKIRIGEGTDLLTTICLAAWRKTLVAPAMNSNMWMNPAVQENLKILKDRGYTVIEPDEGDLACGYTGKGRLPDPWIIDHWLVSFLHPKTMLRDKKVIVTAGRTEEEIDPVRMITNRSSGKMGFALAKEAFYHGANVVLVAGPNELLPPPGVKYVSVVTAQEMEDAVMKNLEGTAVVIASAAVSDYRSKTVLFRKMKKGAKSLKLDLVANPDILAGISKKKGKKILVGFAIETENEITHAREKLKSKKLDMIILNNPVEEGAAFGENTNRVTLIKKRGKPQELPLMSKDEVAQVVLEEIVSLML